jgi:hypothetical protein
MEEGMQNEDYTWIKDSKRAIKVAPFIQGTQYKRPKIKVLSKKFYQGI